jgi:chromosomal replication initiation ATPase DnaA
MTSLEIIASVSKSTGIPTWQIVGPFRTAPIVQARFLAVGILREMLPWWSFQQLASAVGKKDHGQAMHALKRYKGSLEDPAFAAQRSAALRILSRPPVTV